MSRSKKRRRIGWTQKDLADFMGVSKRWVFNFEKYDNDPRLSELRRYEAAVTWALSGLGEDDD